MAVLVGVFVSFVVGMLFLQSGSNVAEDEATSLAATLSNSLLKKCRKEIKEQCSSAKTLEQVVAVSQANEACFNLPLKQPAVSLRKQSEFRFCKHVVIDFGANIGDTLGHVIDSGMIECANKDIKAQAMLVHFNVTSKRFEQSRKRNILTSHLVRLMQEQGQGVGTEDYCYYGVEGNPFFTQRLQAIEDYVLAIRPRPVQHVHFLTESVGAGQDGPTKLFLDTVNTKENFWGSSIMENHQDVLKSSNLDKEKGGSGQKVAAKVMGYTIGTLMRKTLLAFKPGASQDEKKGNHLVLKVDIEGGEYPLLAQAGEDGTLCEFVKMGNKADLYIEFHSKRVTGQHDWDARVAKARESLKQCGVNFRGLEAWWS